MCHIFYNVFLGTCLPSSTIKYIGRFLAISLSRSLRKPFIGSRGQFWAFLLPFKLERAMVLKFIYCAVTFTFKIFSTLFKITVTKRNLIYYVQGILDILELHSGYLISLFYILKWSNTFKKMKLFLLLLFFFSYDNQWDRLTFLGPTHVGFIWETCMQARILCSEIRHHEDTVEIETVTIFLGVYPCFVTIKYTILSWALCGNTQVDCQEISLLNKPLLTPSDYCNTHFSIWLWKRVLWRGIWKWHIIYSLCCLFGKFIFS